MPDENVPGEKTKDCLNLKGVRWPGMDLFDSATSEKKRLRNQRKDVSVLAQMVRTSAEVHPTELVFDMGGQLQKTRDIFGPLSCESSPAGIVSAQRTTRSTKSRC